MKIIQSMGGTQGGQGSGRGRPGQPPKPKPPPPRRSS